MDRAINGVLGEALEHRFQKCDEFGLVHLAAAHGKIAMTNATEATDIAVDRDIVWRVREHEFRLGAFEQALVGGRIAGICAEQTVVSQHPQVSGLGDDRAGWILRHIIFRPA